MTDLAPREDTIDLGHLWHGIRRSAPWILATTLLLGAGTYFLSSSRPEVYSASASLIASNGTGQANDPLLGSAIVKAPPLPEGAIPQAMQSTQVIQPLISAIRRSTTIPAAEKERVLESLQQELRSQQLQTLALSSQIDQYSGGNGIYTVTARARTPQVAAEIANLATSSLLSWDQERALQNIKRAESGYRAQLNQLDQQLKGRMNNVERQTLVARRATISSNLATVAIMRDSATGVLSRLSDAIPPLQPDSPKPVRDAILAGLLGLLLSTAVTALLTILDRTVRREEDLLALDLPALAVIPRIRRRDVLLNGVVRASRQVGMYEPVGFLRVNLLSNLKRPHPIVMIASTVPGEGKSSVTAVLADGFATGGQRVLIIDADLRRGTQQAVWRKFNEADNWHQLVGTGGGRILRTALQDPANVQVMQVAENIDMLPAGEAIHDTLPVFNRADIERAFDIWREHYDIILVDSAPLLALADSLIIGKHVDGVVLVTEYGQTSLQAVRSALRRARNADLNLVGGVINKANVSENESYSYSYSVSQGRKA